MTRYGQLWLKATQEFCLPGSTIPGQNSRWRAPGLRALYWPSGKICWQVNLYLISCRRRGLAVSTVNAYCSELSSFIRFLLEHSIGIFDVVDDDIVDFADWLPTTRKISGTHINRLIFRVIDFYEWAQGSVLGKKIVGRPEESLQISLIAKYVKISSGRTKLKIYHRAMVANSIPRTVHPMSSSDLHRLIDASDRICKSSFVRKRNRMMIVVLADAGVRREELTSITLASIFEAESSGFLKVATSKRKGNPSRLIPLPKATIQALNEYANTSRAILIHRISKKYRNFIDEGWAFCTRYGGRLAPVSVTQLFSDLRYDAGITGVATAHMLRHRFITLQLVARLKSFGSKQAVGVELLTTILSKLASLSGHSTIESLWRYMDWAYVEVDQDLSSDVAEHELAKEIVTSMLKDATEDNDAPLINDLSLVLQSLASLDPTKAGLQSVLSHSVRGRATRLFQ